MLSIHTHFQESRKHADPSSTPLPHLPALSNTEWSSDSGFCIPTHTYIQVHTCIPPVLSESTTHGKYHPNEQKETLTRTKSSARSDFYLRPMKTTLCSWIHPPILLVIVGTLEMYAEWWELTIADDRNPWDAIVVVGINYRMDARKPCDACRMVGNNYGMDAGFCLHAKLQPAVNRRSCPGQGWAFWDSKRRNHRQQTAGPRHLNHCSSKNLQWNCQFNL
jgi:hypothetical protein